MLYLGSVNKMVRRRLLFKRVVLCFRAAFLRAVASDSGECAVCLSSADVYTSRGYAEVYYTHLDELY